MFNRLQVISRVTTQNYVVESVTPEQRRDGVGKRVEQARNQLGTLGGAKNFVR